MGVIQGSINNLLATAGIAARLSPGLEKGREQRQELKTTKERYEITERLLQETDHETYDEEIAKQQTDRARRIAELDPTEKNIKKYLAEAGGYEAVKPENLKAEQELTYAQKARARARQEQAEKDAAEALALEQERAAKSQQFRQMFTEGGRYK